jgi:SAM-dependent methyltransferase
LIHDDPHCRAALEHLRQEIAAAETSVAAQARLAACPPTPGFKLHLGCGPDVRPGWVNVDARVRPPERFQATDHPGTVLVDYDLRKPLPFADGTCAYVYSSHFFEHLDPTDGLALMRECRRVLRLGGTFRAALPDMRAIFRAYLSGDRAFFAIAESLGFVPYSEPGVRHDADYVNWAAYQHGEHKAIYDPEAICSLLRSVGFASAAESAFDPEVDRDTPVRVHHSFYVEATR